MFYVIATILILICAAVVAAVVLRKFPQLTLINTASLPQERDAQKKKKIIDERVSRMTGAFGKKVAALLTAAFEVVRERFRGAYRRVLALERQMRHHGTAPKPKPFVAPEVQEQHIAVLMNEAETLSGKEEFATAESKYIAVLGIDKRNADAYHGLAALYYAWKRFDQAKETYGFLGRMIHKNSRCAHTELGELPEGKSCEADAQTHAEIAACAAAQGQAAQQAGEMQEARAAFERATAFEPANPRHLDLLLDACIMEGDKARALQVFAQLQQANPANQKLTSFAERIHGMPT